MAGYHIVRAAVDAADHPKNHGNGYTLRVHLRGGRTLHGGLLILNDTLLSLDLWEDEFVETPKPSGNTSYIDVTEVAAVEVVW